jgi:hypothetical protein
MQEKTKLPAAPLRVVIFPAARPIFTSPPGALGEKGLKQYAISSLFSMVSKSAPAVFFWHISCIVLYGELPHAFLLEQES